MIHSPKFSSTSDPRLNLISNKKNTMLLSGFSDTWPEIIGWDDPSGFSLDWLHHDSSNPNPYFFTDLKLTFDCFGISERNMIDRTTIELTHWFTIVFFSYHRKGSHRFPMKCLRCHDKSRLFRIHLRELDGSLIGLCTTSRKKTILQISRSNISNHTSQHSSKWIDKFLGWHRIMEKLRMNRFDHLRMRPPMRKQSKSTEPVYILSTRNILDRCTTSRPLDRRMVSGNRH